MRKFVLFIGLLGLNRLAEAAGPVTIDAPDGAQQPQMAADEAGRIHLVFGVDNQVFYTASSDGGATFRKPVLAAKLESLALGRRRGPRIAASGNSIAISAIGGSKENHSDGNLYACTSKDQGSTWHGPLRVNDVDASAREGLHGMAAGPNGEVFCVWLDLRGKGTQIFGSRSTDGGASWSANARIYKSPSGTVCECCHPSVASDAKGRVYVMWRNFVDGNRDMFLATSQDHGETFESAVKLGADSWPLDACPMDGGAVAALADGRVITAWRREHEIFLTNGGILKEQRLGRGFQPWVAAAAGRIYAVWLSAPTGQLFLANSAKEQPTTLAEQAQYPVVAAPLAADGPVVVAWESGDESRQRISVLRVDGQSTDQPRGR